MIICQSCQTKNTTDSRFCNMCGAQLEDAIPDVKPEQISTLLSQGYELIHEEKGTEALFLADAILKIDPENSSALALKAMSHEQRGELDKAVEVYEQIVILNPDSTLDRIKLTQIRKTLETQPIKDELEYRSRKTVAILSGAAAVLLFASTGIVVALTSKRTDNVSEKEEPKEIIKGFEQPNIVSYNNPPVVSPEQQGVDSSQPNTSNNSSFSRQNPLPGGVWNPGNVYIARDPNDSNRLPNPDWGGFRYDFGAGTGTSTNNDPPPNTPAADNEILDPPKQEKKGRVEIRVHEGTQGQDGKDDISAVSDNIYRVAQNKMKAGDYRGAVKDFLASLPGSTRPALTHQLIARCYKSINDNASARRHFEIAKNLYEQAGAINDAKACERELQLLSG